MKSKRPPEIEEQHRLTIYILPESGVEAEYWILKNIDYHGWKLRNIEHLLENVLNTEYFTWQIENREYSPKNLQRMVMFTYGKRNFFSLNIPLQPPLPEMR